MSLKSLVNGIESRYKGRPCLVVDKKLHEINSGNLGSYIRENKQALSIRTLRQHIPELENVPKNKMLFWDIETGGLEGDSPIVSIALAHFSGQTQYDLDLQCLVARTPYEERTVLQYFMNTLPHYEAIFTYNGKTFDIPRVDSRRIHNGLFNGQPLKEILGNRNHDLYWIGQKNGRIRLADKRLQTLEKAIPVFGFKRRGDVEGEDIPRFYLEYVYKKQAGIRETKQDTEILAEARAAVEKHTKYLKEVKGQEMERRERTRLINHAYQERGGEIKKELTVGRKPLEPSKTRANMARIIDHNILDVVSLAAILCYIITGNTPKQELEEDKEDHDNYVPF